MSELSQFAIMAAFGGLCFGCGYLIALIVTRNKWRDEMIKRGVARYNWQTGKISGSHSNSKAVGPAAANGFALSPSVLFRMSKLVSEAATFKFVPRGLPVGPEGHPVPTQ